MSQLIEPSLAAQFDRIPPCAIDAEMCLLASMILDRDCIPVVRSVVDRDAFYQADHQIIFDVLVKLYERNRPIDAVILRNELAQRNLLDEIGGTAYIAQLFSQVPSAAHAQHYARIVADKSLLRRLIQIANDALRDGYGARDCDASALLARHAAALANAATRNATTDYVTMDEALEETWQQLTSGGVPIIPTGIDALDTDVAGLAPGEMVYLAARPSMGKSAMAKQIVRNIARSGVAVGYFSFEESISKIVRNSLSAEAAVDNKYLRNAVNLGEFQWNAIEEARPRLSGLPIYMTRRCRRPDEIRNMVALWKAKHDVRVIVLDHIGWVQADGKTPYERASNASLEVANVIKELNVAGLVLAQLNRGVTARDDKRPTMSDLRDAGRLEEDADGIIMLHREDYYHLDDNRYQPTQIAELIIAKWRDSERGIVVKVKSDMAYQRFEALPVELPEGL
jgi:replicative DNA helicase